MAVQVDQLVSILVERLMPHVSPLLQKAVLIVGTLALNVMIRPETSAVKVGAVALTALFLNYFPSQQSSLPLQLIPFSQHLDENKKTQLTQLMEALGNPDKQHTAVMGADVKELELLVAQLPLLPAFKGYHVYRYQSQGEDLDIYTAKNLQKYLETNPRAILYFENKIPEAYFLKKFPPETLGVISIPDIKAWNSMKRKGYSTPFKLVYLNPLSQSECRGSLEQWWATQPFSSEKTLESNVVDAALIIAFSILEKEQDKLAFIKDWIERTAKRGVSREISIYDLCETLVLMYPALQADLSEHNHGRAGK